MATTLITSPTFPIEGDTVALSVSGSANDTFVFEVVSVPPLSSLALGFLLSTNLGTFAQSQVAATAQAVIDAAADGAAIGSQFVADRGGEYGINVWEFRSFVGGGASFPGDPSADPRSDLKAVASFTVDVGVLIDLPLVTAAGDGVTLRLKVNGDTVREAGLIGARTERGRLAALEANTVAAVAAMVGSTVTAMGHDLIESANDLLANYAAHRVLVDIGGDAVHQNADTINATRSPLAKSQVDAVAVLNDLRENILGHLRDGPLSGAGFNWHVTGQEDTRNLPLAAAAVDVASATVLSAELRERVYERHRFQVTGGTPPFDDPASHEDVADTVNGLTLGTSPLDLVVVSYFDAIADITPAAAAGESQGAQDAVNRYGFQRVASDLVPEATEGGGLGPDV